VRLRPNRGLARCLALDAIPSSRARNERRAQNWWDRENPSVRGISHDWVNDPERLDHGVDIVNAED
jgi:hypothetical protein